MSGEELFEIIDGIDDDIILDIPRSKSIRPTMVLVERIKTPIPTFALVAVCMICVLAVGVFFAAKLHNIPPVDSGSDYSVYSDSSSDESSDSDSESSSSHESSSSISESSNSEDISNINKVRFTDEDKELQKILEELDKGLSAISAWLTFSYPQDSPKHTFVMPNGNRMSFYPISDGFSIGGLNMPTTYEAMREMVLEYFSEQFADDFMYHNVGTGTMEENPDGTFSVTLDENSDNDYYKFIAIDGKIYCHGDSAGGRGLSYMRILCPTAKILNKTEDTIEFAYFNDLNMSKENIIFMQSCINDVSLYEANTNIGVLKYERGGWRRDKSEIVL